MFNKKESSQWLELALQEIESLHYAEQFLDLFPDFFSRLLPVSGMSLFFIDKENTQFIFYPDKKLMPLKLLPLDWNSNLLIYLKKSKKTIILKDENPSRIQFLEKTEPDFFKKLAADIIIPLFSLKKLYGFTVIAAGGKTYKELGEIENFFRIFANILIPQVVSERMHLEHDRNYYKIFRMDRLALVGELAASAAHEIKNPLAGISTFLKYFSELPDFNKNDITEELQIMRDSVRRIDEIVKSLLSFSRFKKKKIEKINLLEIIEASLNSLALKIPSNINILKKIDDTFVVETDFQHLQQVLINILLNAAEAVGKLEKGEITIHIYVSGRDQLPSAEMFNISIKDNGPGISESFKEKLFQPFQTTKEEGTGLGLYTCYGLMKSLGGCITINNAEPGTEVILSLPYSFDEEEQK